MTQGLRVGIALCLAPLLPATAYAQSDDPAACPPLGDIRAEAARATPREYAVTRDYTDNRGETRHRRAHYDPRRDPDRAWNLELRNEAPPDDKFLRKYMKDPPPPPPSYARVAAVLAGEARCLEASDARAVYAVDRPGEGAILLDGEDISVHFSAEVVVDRTAARPFVSELRFTLEEPFKPRWLVKITAAAGRATFARSGPGAPVIVLQEFTASGSRPFGSFEYETRSDFSDHERVAAP